MSPDLLDGRIKWLFLLVFIMVVKRPGMAYKCGFDSRYQLQIKKYNNEGMMSICIFQNY